jgi:4-diphosphocytidyl-2-C-methyl-D-erythritol kinase
LGSDCPFFIINRPCLAGGRGEQLRPIEVDLSNYKVVLIYPNIHINTAWAFSKIQPAANRSSIADIIALPIGEWKAQLTNDFETVVFEQYPKIKKIKDDLYAAGAVYASLSGSGSTVFGLFAKDITPRLEWPESYFVKSI